MPSSVQRTIRIVRFWDCFVLEVEFQALLLKQNFGLLVSVRSQRCVEYLLLNPD
jgi:hypothetical protein